VRKREKETHRGTGDRMLVISHPRIGQFGQPHHTGNPALRAAPQGR